MFPYTYENKDNLKNYDETIMFITGTYTGKLACSEDNPCEIYISFKENTNYEYHWVDENGDILVDENGNEITYITLKWWINPIKIKKPEVWIETTGEDGGKVRTQYKEGEDFSFDYSGYAPSYPECWKTPVAANGTSIQNECYADNKKYTDVLTMTGDEDGLSRQYAYKDGGYSITFAIKDAESCSWETDGDELDTDDYIVKWYINKIKVHIPVKESEEDFTYNDNYFGVKDSGYRGDRCFVVNNYNNKIMTYNNSYNCAYAFSAGVYTITYNLYDTGSCSWEDDSVTPKSIDWKIKKQKVYFDVPYLEDGQKSFKYDGTLHEPVITYDEKKNFNYKEVSGTFSSKAANKDETPYYEIRVRLRENSNYDFLWKTNDIITDPKQDIILQWRVLKSSFKVPKVRLEHRPFTGQTQYEYPSEENGYFSKVMKYTGKTSGKKADTYEIVYELLDRNSSSWEDENGNIIDNEPKSVFWYIDRIIVPVPNVTETELPVSWYVSGGNVYCNYQSPLVDGYNEYLMSKSEYSECYPNEYTLKFCLLDSESSAWDDENHTTGCKEFPWCITKEIKQYERPRFTPEYPVFDYNGKEQIAAWENYKFSLCSGNYRFERFYNQNVMRYIQNSDRGTKAKDYSVTVEFCENNIFDFQWTNGTKDPVTLPWKINFKKSPKPDLESRTFKFTNTQINVKENGFVEYVMARTSDSKTYGTKAGEYTITYYLTDKTSSSWEDGSTGDITIKWNIIALTDEENAVEIPTVTDTEFTYDGEYHNPIVSEYNENIIGYRGNKSAVNANEYYITFYLKNPNSSCWTDGTVEDKKKPWVIKKLVEYIERPKIEDGYQEFEYDGRYKITRITGFISSKMILKSPLGQINSGTHKVIIELPKTQNYEYCWIDNSTENAELEWVIKPAVLTEPEIEPALLYYTGGYLHPYVTGFDPYTMSSNLHLIYYYSGYHYKTDQFGRCYYQSVLGWDTLATRQINVGNYPITFEPKDKACTWDKSGNNGIIYRYWSIEKEVVLLPKPRLAGVPYVYDGTEKEPEIIHRNAGITFTGDLRKTAEGTYKIKAVLNRDENCIKDYRWEDNTTSPSEIDLEWHITHGTAQIPELAPYPPSFPYDGKEHIPAIDGLDKNKVKCEKYIKQTKAGEYEIIFSLKDDKSCSWENGDTNIIVLKWYIT